MRTTFMVVTWMVGGMLGTPAYAEPSFPTVELVSPVERQSTGGCRNPVADAWADQSDFDLLTDATPSPALSAPPAANLLDLPAYLTEESKQ